MRRRGNGEDLSRERQGVDLLKYTFAKRFHLVMLLINNVHFPAGTTTAAWTDAISS